jgi:hypothetical protein
MSSPDFSSILSKSASAIEEPKPLPVGTYICVVNAAPELTKIGQKETPAAVFQLRPIRPMDDVDSSALAEAGNWQERNIRHTLYLTEEALYRLKEFLGHLGLDVEGDASLGELISGSPGRQVAVSISHRPAPDGSRLYVDVKKTAAV